MVFYKPDLKIYKIIYTMPYKNKEDAKLWRLKNKEKTKEYYRLYYIKNKDKMIKQAGVYQKENKVRVNELERKRYKNRCKRIQK